MIKIKNHKPIINDTLLSIVNDDKSKNKLSLVKELSECKNILSTSKNNSTYNKKKRQTFCNFNDDNCKSDTETGEIYVKLLCGGKKVINAHYYKYIPLKDTQVDNPLVITLASGYRWDKLKVFITSLRKSGYDGSLLLFVDVNFNQSNLSFFFKKYNVTTILIDNEWPFYSKLNKIYPIDEVIIKDCMIPNREYLQYKWVVYRISLLYCFLKQYRSLFSHILYVDCRDIMFQLNPFAWNIQPYLYLVEETDANYCIGVDPFDRPWVDFYDYASHVYNCRILNSGTILGEKEYFYTFIELYNQFLKDDFKITSEQGTLNYIFYTQNLTHIPIMMNRNGYGFALTLAVDLLHRPDNSFFPHSDMYVYNKDGKRPCLVHQYDRKIYKYIDWEKFRSNSD